MKTFRLGLKRRKKKKNKDPKDAVATRKGEDDAAGPSTSMIEPEDAANEATPVTAEGTKTSKKKKKHKKDDAHWSSRRPKRKRCQR